MTGILVLARTAFVAPDNAAFGTVALGGAVDQSRLVNFTPIMYPTPISVYVGVVISERCGNVSDSAHNAYALLPAIYSALKDALWKYRVKFIPQMNNYRTCEAGVNDGVTVDRNWASYQKSLELLLGKSTWTTIPTTGMAGHLLVGPACTADMLQACTTTTAFPTNIVTGGGENVDSTAQYPYLSRCSYNTFSQWSTFITFTRDHHWSSFAIYYSTLRFWTSSALSW
ncbi:hypothetical protein RvY_10503 [Ramazzottius varieornatus]|uniref:Receptor ligand binding region domain-containing protein n=1 Tax=Ramazzottius varieornatus TaxID=947166 RepID=A0A1D1VF17_RAMVA|nr:hypothetical protein RvY_10503 [Ramazzottius varieornatus]